MASPLREKRTWPPREKDAESAESAAFEATVAVVKETVVRSGEVLVSAKEDLSDRRGWPLDVDQQSARLGSFP